MPVGEPRKKKFMVHLSEKEYDQLFAMATQDKVSMGQFLRVRIRQEAARREKAK